MSKGKDSWKGDHYSICFQIVKEKQRISPHVKVLNWDNANFNGIREEHAKVGWERLLAGEWTVWQVGGF